MAKANKQLLVNELVRAQACLMRLDSKQLSYEDVKDLSSIGYGLFTIGVAINHREATKSDLIMVNSGIETVNRYLDSISHSQPNLNEAYKRLTKIKGMLENELKN